eukprot:403330854
MINNFRSRKTAYLATVGLLLASTAQSYKIAVMNDIHVDLSFDPTTCSGGDEDTKKIHLEKKQTSDPRLLGMLGCDPPKELLMAFLDKLKQQDPTDLDFLLIPGDLVAHGIPLEPTDPSKGNYTLLKETINTVSQTISQYFPNTLVIPSLGNNDPKYHYVALNHQDKAEYFSFLFDSWFNQISGNKNKLSVEQLADIKGTFLKGGYYRVDVDDKLSVLALNTLNFNKKNDESQQGTDAPDQMNWFKSQLANGGNRKFLITNHIYPGAKFISKSKDLFHPEYNTQYFDILNQYKDRIVIEVSAHDHFSDVRYHSDGNEDNKQFYHNLIVSPGISPVKNQNPGIAHFEIDRSTFIPQNLRMIFIALEQTYALTKSQITAAKTNLPFRTVTFSDYGLYQLTAEALHTFKSKLENDDELTYKYSVAKLGFDPNNKTEFELGINLYINDMGLITSSKRKTYKLICQMHLSKDSTELDKCIQDGKDSSKLSASLFLQ